MLRPGCSRCRVSGVSQLLTFPKSCLTASPEFWGPALTFQPAPAGLSNHMCRWPPGARPEKQVRREALARGEMGAEGQGRETAAGLASPGSGFGGLAVFFPAAAGLRGRGGGSPAGGTPPTQPGSSGPAPRGSKGSGAEGRGGPGREPAGRRARRGRPLVSAAGRDPGRSAAQDGRGGPRLSAPASPRPPLPASSARPARGRAPPARGWATSVSAPDGRDPRSAGGWGWGSVAPQSRSRDAPDALGPLPSAPRSRGPGTASAECELLGSVHIPSNCRYGGFFASPRFLLYLGASCG